jgi:phenylalanyl-tRNA synthetase beta chain
MNADVFTDIMVASRTKSKCDKIAADKKSVALSVTLQPVDKSLTDVEIDAVAAKIKDGVVKAVGATLRA